MTDRERLLRDLPDAEIVTRERDGRTEYRVRNGGVQWHGRRLYWGRWCRTEERAWAAALASRTSYALDRMDE